MESRGYKYVSVLGEGMYGKVVKARLTRLKETVAIKVIDTKKVSSAYVEKFLSREIDIIKTLNHPNIVTTFDIFQLNAKVYVVMELCVKGDLLKYITVNGAIPEHSSRRLFTQVCMAVQYLHNMDVAHRDLKCENLLLDTHYNLKLCDFGFSKRLTYSDGKMELSQTYCGTSSYAAPEILKNFPYNPKVSDVWSMGVVLHMMLYGAMPYDASNIKTMVGNQMQHNISFPKALPVSSEAKDLIRNMLHPVVEQRIAVSQIFQTFWMSSTCSRHDGPDRRAEHDEGPSHFSDPCEGPSTAGPGQSH